MLSKINTHQNPLGIVATDHDSIRSIRVVLTWLTLPIPLLVIWSMRNQVPIIIINLIKSFSSVITCLSSVAAFTSDRDGPYQISF